MGRLFINLVNLSITASWLAAAVILIRLVFRKAPKWIFCVLWGLVALRLICPISVESELSLIPSTQTLPAEAIYSEDSQISENRIHTGIDLIDGKGENLILREAGTGSVLRSNMNILGWIWFAGMAAMLIYAFVSYIRLKRRVSTATAFSMNIKQSEFIGSPFVLGFFRPVIYLPYSIDSADLEYVIAHEKAHIKRKDHWWKTIGFALLAVYWFNPLMWISYIFLCRDIEAACDEKVIRNMEKDDRRAYSAALLNCSVRRRAVAACPLAFGEVNVKDRIKKVMNYKKPGLWVIIAAVLACAIAAVCFLTDPAAKEAGGAETPNIDRPMIKMDGELYVNPYMPVSALPYGYEFAGKLTAEQANNTGLDGMEYYVNTNDPEDFYVYQECGTPTGTNTVDSTKRQWAFVRWVKVGTDTVSERKLTLDDVVMLSKKGNDLKWSDFDLYSYVETGSGLYIRYYEIDEMFYLLIGGVPASEEDEPENEYEAWYFYLMANDETQAQIDIRTEDVQAFIDEHKDNEVWKDSFMLRAEVIQIQNGSMLVKPVEGSQELRSSDLFSINIGNMPASPEPEVGDTVEIRYNGEIMESYPAQLGEIYGITVIE